jgi:hypothetical protein
MIKDYALVNKETKIVSDMVVWDGESWLPEEYFAMYDIIESGPDVKGYPAAIGDTYSTELNGFVPPAPLENPEMYYLDEERLVWVILPEFNAPPQ